MKLKTYTPNQTEKGQKIIEVLKGVNDSIKRYKVLSTVAKSDELKAFYTRKLKERKTFRKHLASYADTMGLNTGKSGSLTGAVSRLHTKIKTVFDNDEDQVSINKALYHDQSLMHDYEFILNKPEILEEDLQELLQNQLKTIQKDVLTLEHFY